MPSQLQNLSNQFNSLLNEYQDTSKKYTDLVNENDDTLTQISDSSFIGESNLSVLGEPNVSACQSACSANKSCSGATFNTTSNNCTLSSGQGNVIPTSKSVAIVQQAIYYKNRLKELNYEMTSLNQQMMDISNQNYNQYSKNTTLSKEQEAIMVNNHNVLIQERKKIKVMMNQYQTLSTAYEDGSTTLNVNYMHYVVFLFVVIFLVLLLLRTAISSPQYGGGSHKSFGKFLNFL
jgi:regulator of replication initiation timing